ncbi:MAG: hypothetical protein NTY71_01595 [Methanoregula sp.]|jgi:hypothetical protein|nr:hypothetical protein [Methanoregula sp.]
MRTPDRDRCRPAISALCAALVITLLVIPCAALHAEYRVLSNGTAYNASIDVADVNKFDFFELGMMGERIPQKVGNIEVTGNCSPCEFNVSGISSITFARGNYTILYTAPMRDYHLQAAFDSLYRVNVTLPQDFDARNPLLAGISSGAVIIGEYDNTTTVMWNRTMSVDLRFYDNNREALLYMFGNFWVVIAIVLLVPFLITVRRKG